MSLLLSLLLLLLSSSSLLSKQTAHLLLGSDWVNPEDPNVIAENELLGAASAIEAAARKLAELKPRERPRVSNCWINDVD